MPTKPESQFYLGDRVKHTYKAWTGYVCRIDYSPALTGSITHHQCFYTYLVNIDSVPQKEWVAAINLERID